jgi:hypothetical protein
VGLAIRPDTVFVENAGAFDEDASPRYVLSLPDLFLIIAQNLYCSAHVHCARVTARTAQRIDDRACIA